ncbi:hypothetical protein EST38_g13466 [Candolleomyces aberdarensis]|uniref:G domain-containing protein n=1 Tax=Candolleomyces aberdarensis TaxID=2316362 RepID=A0A4Q2D0M2_9AGAR|nr:hypothetical protein EST38_g13466 [Candolleomyces aberdarensis]
MMKTKKPAPIEGAQDDLVVPTLGATGAGKSTVSVAPQDAKNGLGLGDAKNDTIFRDAQETDIVIPIMGPPGAGKSSFINSLLRHLGSPRHVKVGENLSSTSCTREVESIIIEGQTNHWKRIKDHRVVLVDTPGFGDTQSEDFEVLQRIARGLEQSYRKKMVLGGVIYMHDISQDQFVGIDRRNLEMFNHLCGDSALDKVVLVTSKWGRASQQDFDKREGELKGKQWKTMIDGGARVERLVAGEEQASAWGIVRSILDRVETREIQQTKSEGLQIQRELVNRQKYLPQTHAARELRAQLEQMIEAQTRMLVLEADAAAGNEEAKAQLLEKEAKLKQLVQQVDNLKVSPLKRLARWTRLTMEG